VIKKALALYLMNRRGFNLSAGVEKCGRKIEGEIKSCSRIRGRV
jgi:hypothetical protein